MKIIQKKWFVKIPSHNHHDLTRTYTYICELTTVIIRWTWIIDEKFSIIVTGYDQCNSHFLFWTAALNIDSDKWEFFVNDFISGLLPHVYVRVKADRKVIMSWQSIWKLSESLKREFRIIWVEIVQIIGVNSIEQLVLPIFHMIIHRLIVPKQVVIIVRPRVIGVMNVLRLDRHHCLDRYWSHLLPVAYLTANQISSKMIKSGAKNAIRKGFWLPLGELKFFEFETNRIWRISWW